MKKYLVAGLSFLLFVFIVGCGSGSGSGDASDTPDSPGETTTLDLTINYTGAQVVSSTKKLWVEVYDSAGGLLSKSSSSLIDSVYYTTATASEAFTCDPMACYLLLYIDKNDDWAVSTGEPYVIYNSQTKTGTPTPLDMASDKTISITFGDDNLW